MTPSHAPSSGELVITINGQVFNPEPRVENIQLDPPVEPVAVDADELNCLAMNIYHEARGESETGRLAVANVTMNRVNHYKYPDTICGVVQQGIHYTNWKGNLMPKRHKCQFSWYCDGKADTVFENRAWANSLDSGIGSHDGYALVILLTELLITTIPTKQILIGPSNMP